MKIVHDRAVVIGVLFIGLFSYLAVLAGPGYASETKTAYTRDGINFISKERMEENIRYEYARPGDYREVVVPLDIVVVGASTIPENLTVSQEKDNGSEEGKSPANASQTDKASNQENKYPYAAISIGLLILCGMLFAAASVLAGRGRR
jgi:hypothetical protein